MLFQKELYCHNEQQQQQQAAYAVVIVAVGRLYNRESPIMLQNKGIISSSDKYNDVNCSYTRLHESPPPNNIFPGLDSSGECYSKEEKVGDDLDTDPETEIVIKEGENSKNDFVNLNNNNKDRGDGSYDWALAMERCLEVRIEEDNKEAEAEDDGDDNTNNRSSRALRRNTFPYCNPESSFLLSSSTSMPTSSASQQQQQQQQELDSSSGDESSSDDVDICHNSIMKPEKERNLFLDHIHTAIVEEKERRHVTFPAQEIVSLIKGGGNNQRILQTVQDKVAIHFVPHLSDYNEEQRTQLWYTQDEMDIMRNIYVARCNERKQQRKRNELLVLIKEQDTLASSVCQFFSFLSPTKRKTSSSPSIWCTRKHNDCFFPSNDEDLVDIYFNDCSRMAKKDDDEDNGIHSGNGEDKYEVSSTPLDKNDDDDDDPYRRRRLYETSVAAVLNEQHKQRVMYQHMYGRAILKGQRSILDPDRISQVYTVEGDTKQCQHLAEVSAAKNKQYNILHQEEEQLDVVDDNDNDDDVSKDYPDLNHNHNDELQDQQDDEGGDDLFSSLKSFSGNTAVVNENHMDCIDDNPSTSCNAGIIDADNTKTTDTTCTESDTTCTDCDTIIGDSLNYSSSSKSQQQLHCKHPFTFLRTFDVCIVSSSFRTLLRPILQLSQGDLFLENIGGEEMHL